MLVEEICVTTGRGGKEGGGGGGKGGERREGVAGEKEHQELGRALDRLHAGRVQANTWRPRRRHS